MTPFDRVIALCEERGISEGRACERAGVARNLLSQARAKGTDLSLPALEAFGKAFMVPLAHLLGEAPPAVADGQEDPAIRRIPLLSIHPSPLNPRKSFDEGSIRELAASIEAQGLLQNLVVRRDAECDPREPVYHIVAGERRWRALDLMATESRLPIEIRDHGVPCRIIEATDADHLAIALLENLQRQDVNPAEEAEGFARLQQLNPERWTTRAIAEAVGISQRAVQQRLALVQKLAPQAMEQLRAGEISFSQARVLATVPAERQAELLAEIDTDPGIVAEDLRALATQHMVPVSRAIFDPSFYDGPYAEDEEGNMLFADRRRFEALQLDFVRRKAEALRGEGHAWVRAAGSGQGTTFFANNFDHRPGDPDAGAVVNVNGDWSVEIHTGLVPNCPWARTWAGLAPPASPEAAPATQAAPAAAETASMPITKAHWAHARRRKSAALQAAIADGDPIHAQRLVCLALLGAHGTVHLREEPIGEDDYVADDRVVASIRHRVERYLSGAYTGGIAVDRWRGVHPDSFKLPSEADLWIALAAMPDDQVTRLFTALVALRVGSWTNSGVVGPGDEPGVRAIATTLGLAGAEPDHGLTLDPADLDGIRKDEMKRLARRLGVRDDLPDKLPELKAHVASAASHAVLPSLRFDTPDTVLGAMTGRAG